MDKRISRTIAGCLPPLLLRLLQRLFRRHGFFGNYASWEEASRASTGFDADLILVKVRDALLKVKNGEAAYERDSVLFDEIHYAWPLLAGLLWIASQTGNRLSVLDFGGSLGSSYFQNRRFLDHLTDLRWSIVEQKRFVDCGMEYFADERLGFYHTIDECFREEKPRVAIFSSVIPYLEKPYALLEEITATGVDFIIVDRTPILEEGLDRLTVQRASPKVYDASYPAWILSRRNLLNFFTRDYELVVEFDALAGTIPLDDAVARDKGFIFRRRAASESK